MWEYEWKLLSKRVDSWAQLADAALRHIEHAPALRETANRALGHEANELVEAIAALIVPEDLRRELAQVRQRLGSMYDVDKGERVVPCRLLVLAALRIPLDKASRQTETPRRRLVDRAFLHLNRTLTVVPEVRSQWSTALERGETRCEQLGAIHLLSHGIYAFKADAGSGRTDLILGEPLRITDEVETADAMVLTEWKLVRDEDHVEMKAAEGRAQAARYAANELAAFELRTHRYVVLVSEHELLPPRPETDGGVTYHYINVAVSPHLPSQQSRAATRGSRRRPSQRR